MEFITSPLAPSSPSILIIQQICSANTRTEYFLQILSPAGNEEQSSFQRSRGLSWSPSNYEELGWKRYFLMSEWDQNRTRASVAIDINARLYSVAIMYPLWLPHSHNMTDFCAFLTYFYHLSHTAVTVIIQTGSFRVLNLPHI